MEIERAEGRIGSSLQAHPEVTATPDYVAAMAGVDLAEISITSAATLVEVEDAAGLPEGAFTVADVPGVATVARPAQGEKCPRCWRVLPEVGTGPGKAEVCGRCADAVDRILAAAGS